MTETKTVRMAYGRKGLELAVPAFATLLEGKDIPALPDPHSAVMEALENPIGSASLLELVREKNPESVAITISDITRPVPNRQFLPGILEVLNAAGIADSQVVIVIGTGMHRSSTDAEREVLVGPDILKRIEVIDHQADDPATLIEICDEPPISLCHRFAEADFRIVTGFIEPHFMAGFSGGRKGVCPALVNLETVQRFHGFRTLENPAADTGNLKQNPCHEIALEVAKRVGVDFLFNVLVTRNHDMAGIYCGDLELAHQAGCRQVTEWITAYVEDPFDLVITSAGGFPLDQTFYQAVKGMCTALPVLGENSTLLQVSECSEGIGSKVYTDMMLGYSNDWPGFLKDIEKEASQTRLDQWQYQMQARVLSRIGLDKLWFASDRIPVEEQALLSIKPLSGSGDAGQRAQQAVDDFMAVNPAAKVAVIPAGPYTMLQHGRNN